MHDFYYDNDWQQQIRDAILVPQFYQKYAEHGGYVLLDKGNLAVRLQKELGIDTILQVADGEVIAIEEKIVRWPGYPYSAFCLETHSCTVPGRESPGWMAYSAADYLLYCFVTADGGLDAYLINMPALKAWFWPIHEQFDTFGPLPTLNRTMGRKVPIIDVQTHVGASPYRLDPVIREMAA